MDGAFFFGSSTAFEKEANNILDTKTMIIDIVDVPFMDITAMFTLLDLVERLKKEDVTIGIVLKASHKQELLKVDKTNLLGDIDLYYNIKDAIKNN